MQSKFHEALQRATSKRQRGGLIFTEIIHFARRRIVVGRFEVGVDLHGMGLHVDRRGLQIVHHRLLLLLRQRWRVLLRLGLRLVVVMVVVVVVVLHHSAVRHRRGPVARTSGLVDLVEVVGEKFFLKLAFPSQRASPAVAEEAEEKKGEG